MMSVPEYMSVRNFSKYRGKCFSDLYPSILSIYGMFERDGVFMYNLCLVGA